MSHQNVDAVPTPSEYNLFTQIATASFGRFLINTSRRFLYPFAPALSRCLGVPLTSITSLVALNQITGMMSPLFGPVIDRWGYRLTMMIGLSIMAVGLLAGGFVPLYGIILIAVFLAGLGKSVFDPALQAYIGESVPYHKRGTVVGLVEISWATSSLVGIPVAGYLIAYLGWRAPFFVLGGLVLSIVALLGLVLPKKQRKNQPASIQKVGWAWQQLRRQPAALGFLAYGFFVSAANDNLFVVVGAWLEDGFGLTLVALGTATMVIGFAELSGELLASTVADRVGLKRAIIVSLALATVAYAILSLTSQYLTLALVGFFVLFLIFEFMIVTSVSMATELLPQARATLMAYYLATAGLGRMVGAIIGGPVWLSGGLWATGGVSAITSLLGLVVLRWGLRNWRK